MDFLNFLRLNDKTVLDESDIPYALQFLALTFIGWWACYIVCDVFFSHSGMIEAFKDLSPTKKADFLSRSVANIHAGVSCSVALLAFFITWYITS